MDQFLVILCPFVFQCQEDFFGKEGNILTFFLVWAEIQLFNEILRSVVWVLLLFLLFWKYKQILLQIFYIFSFFFQALQDFETVQKPRILRYSMRTRMCNNCKVFEKQAILWYQLDFLGDNSYNFRHLKRKSFWFSFFSLEKKIYILDLSLSSNLKINLHSR